MRKFLMAALLGAAVMGGLSATAFANDTMGNDYRVRVVNRSSHVVVGVYATNRDEFGWDVNLLDEDLYPGESAVIDLDDYSGYCKYDMQARSDIGGDWTRYGANVCTLETWTLRD